jgi:hypothetical protein
MRYATIAAKKGDPKSGRETSRGETKPPTVNVSTAPTVIENEDIPAIQSLFAKKSSRK